MAVRRTELVPIVEGVASSLSLQGDAILISFA